MAATINSQQTLEAILAMESGSGLSFPACASSQESESDEDPCERNVPVNPFMVELFSLRVKDFIILYHYYLPF